MRFVVLIPARLKSTRLANKPLADIHGKPMIVRVVEKAKRSGAQRVWVATDDQEIVDVLRALGHEAVMTSTNHHCGTERLAEAADILGLSNETIVVNVQGDEPLVDPKLIDATADRLAAERDLSVSTVAHPFQSASDFFSSSVVKVVLDQRERALYFSRAPIPYQPSSECVGLLRHIGLYAYRAGFLRTYSKLAVSPIEKMESLEQLRVLWHGYKVGVHIAEASIARGVDTMEDLEYVRSVFH